MDRSAINHLIRMSAATSLSAVARAAASGATVARLVLRGSPDLVCVNIMCDKVGEVRPTPMRMHL
jgi:hypothetical protein